MKEYSSSIGCPLCGARSERILTDRLRRGSGRVFFCEACQHGFLDLKPDFDMKEYYGEEYRKEYSNKANASKTNAQELFDVYRRYQASRLEVIEPSLSENKSLIEVGCSAGQFIDHVKKNVRLVNGIELDKDCCSFVNNEIKISCDNNYLPESAFRDERYDIVCAFQVMEHVPDPVSFLSELIDASAPDGEIFVEVPNLHDPLISVWDNNAYKDFYYHSAHLHYFSKDSLLKVAMDAGVNVQNVRFVYTQDYNLLNHINWITNNSPQEDCHVGLSPIDIQHFNSEFDEITSWLKDKLTALNEAYIEKLQSREATSNIMMIIRNDK